MSAHHIYHLIDPRDRLVRYVGKSGNPAGRLRAHIQEAVDAQNTAKKRWIAELTALGLRPVLVIAATAPDEPAARRLESAHCHQHAATIHNLHDPNKGARDLKK